MADPVSRRRGSTPRRTSRSAAACAPRSRSPGSWRRRRGDGRRDGGAVRGLRRLRPARDGRLRWSAAGRAPRRTSRRRRSARVLIAIGTLVSDEPVLAGVVALIVGFIVMQVAAFGGAWATGMFATTLAFVLAATFAGPASRDPDSPLGMGPRWSRRDGDGAGAVARVRAAGALARSSRTRSGRRRPSCARTARPRTRAAAAAAVAVAPTGATRRPVSTVRSGGSRPRVRRAHGGGGATRGPRAERRRPAARARRAPARRDGRRCSTRRRRASPSPTRPIPDLGVLDTARSEHLAAMTEWAGDQLRAGASPDEVLSGLRGSVVVAGRVVPRHLAGRRRRHRTRWSRPRRRARHDAPDSGRRHRRRAQPVHPCASRQPRRRLDPLPQLRPDGGGARARRS